MRFELQNALKFRCHSLKVSEARPLKWSGLISLELLPKDQTTETSLEQLDLLIFVGLCLLGREAESVVRALPTPRKCQ